MITQQKQRSTQPDDLSYIFESIPLEEYFQPKIGRSPHVAKQRDARGARRQDYYWRGPNVRDDWGEGDFGLTKNGIPYFKQDGRTHFRVSGYHRPKTMFHHRLKRGNGKVESYIRSFSTPDLQGKTSRARMKLHDQWWLEAVDTLQHLHQNAA